MVSYLKRTVSLVIAFAAIGCNQDLPTSNNAEESSLRLSKGHSCATVQGALVATIAGFDGPALIFSGTYTGDLVGNSTVRLVFTEATGAALRFTIDQTVELTGGDFTGNSFTTSGKGVNATLNRIHSKEKLTSGGRGNLTFNGIDTGGAGADLAYHGVLCLS